ncbi:MAG: hypothetical protein WC758_00580 [Candidatus Woesearchaeota archaeon]|jgi:hypothetical protein
MNCKLCDKEILNYSSKFNHLKIDESCSVDICSNCIDKVVDWQGSVVAKLFPTKSLKKRYK